MRCTPKFLTLVLLFIANTPFMAQSTPRVEHPDPVVYEIYSTVLSTYQHSDRTRSKELVIRGETLMSLGAFINTVAPKRTCLSVGEEQREFVGQAVDDYVRVNQRKWRLDRKFKLDMSYTLFDPQRVTSIWGEAQWRQFYVDYPESKGIIDLSAIGFNADKTVAIFSVGRWCGPLCGEGGHQFLQKKDGKWIPFQWKGEACHWIS